VARIIGRQIIPSTDFGRLPEVISAPLKRDSTISHLDGLSIKAIGILFGTWTTRLAARLSFGGT
jgi:hypothetical protein